MRKEQTFTTNIVYFETNFLEKYSFREKIKQIVDIAIEFLHKDKCEYLINMISNKEYKELGYGYIWLEYEEVAFILIGLNPDGTLHISQEIDPEWKEPETPKLEELHKIDKILKENNYIGLWSDYMDAYDDIIIKYTPRTISKKIEPVIDPGFYQFEHTTESRKNRLKSKRSRINNKIFNTKENIKNFTNNKDDEDDEEDNLELQELGDKLKNLESITDEQLDREIPKIDKIILERSWINDINRDIYRHNVLSCYSVPEEITEQKLNSIFSRYVTEPINECTEERYPVVNFNKDRKVFIKFSPKTRDAENSLLMNKKVYFTLSNGEKISLLFKHDYISRKPDNNRRYKYQNDNKTNHEEVSKVFEKPDTKRSFGEKLKELVSI